MVFALSVQLVPVSVLAQEMLEPATSADPVAVEQQAVVVEEVEEQADDVVVNDEEDAAPTGDAAIVVSDDNSAADDVSASEGAGDEVNEEIVADGVATEGDGASATNEQDAAEDTDVADDESDDAAVDDAQDDDVVIAEDGVLETEDAATSEQEGSNQQESDGEDAAEQEEGGSPAVSAPTTDGASESSQPRRAELLQKIQDVQQNSSASADVEPYVSGEVLVRFKTKSVDLTTAAGKSFADAFAREHNLARKSLIAASNIAVYRTVDGETTPDAITRLRWVSEVLHAQPNFVYRPLSVNDPRFNDLWALQPGVMNATAAWEKNEGDGIVVAVIDDGVAFNHPDLKDNMWDGTDCLNDEGQAMGGCVHGYDFDNNDVVPLPNDTHGTHVAGTIGAVGNNGVGIVGVSPKVRIMALRGSTTDRSIRAINFARFNAAYVINASWSTSNRIGQEMTANDIALKEAIGKFDGLFVAAAGNGDEFGNPNIGDQHGEEVVLFPCDFDVENIVCVAATDESGGLASFSDHGKEFVDVAAPGVSILSTIPEDTTLFSEDFEDVGSGFTGGSADVWFTFTSDGNTVLVAAGESGDTPESSSATSSIIDLSENSEGTLKFSALCSARADDSAVLQFWDGTNWDSIHAFVGEEMLDASYSLSRYGNSDFKFRIVWIDIAIDNDQSLCLFDNFTVTVFDDGSSDKYDSYPGTSMAAPHVAGVAALVMGYNANLKHGNVAGLTAAKQNEIVKKIIMETGDDLSDADKAKIAEGKGKRVNAANALAIFAPHIGFFEDDVLPASELNTQGILGDGQAAVKIPFRVRDDVAGLPATLSQFEYSTDDGETWQAPANGDASDAIRAAHGPDGDWRDDEYTTALEYSEDLETAFTLIWHIQHEDLTGLDGVEQDDVHVRFKVNDGATDSPFAESEAFSVDLLAPTASVVSRPDAVTTSTSATIVVGGEGVVEYMYWMDGDGTTMSTPTPVAEPIALTGLTDGDHFVKIIGVDAAGNWQTNAAASLIEWTVDTTPGTALFTIKPDARTNATSATFVVGGEDVATYMYTLDGGAVQGPFSVDTTIALADLAEGSHTIAATGIDALGNEQASPTTYTWVIDTTPPTSSGGGGGGGSGGTSAVVLSLSGAPVGTTNATTATITVSGEDVIAYRYALDGGDTGSETPVAEPILLSGLADGTHTVAVIGRDDVGNWTADANAVTATWTVDTIAPTLAETTPVATPTNDVTPSLSITVENGATWEVLRGETALASGTGAGEAQVVELAELTDGIYTLTLSAMDAAGNAGTLALTEFVVDTKSPTGLSLTGVPDEVTNVTSATITVAAGQDIVAYRFALDGGAFGDEVLVATPIALADLADGTHTLRVIGKDAAGNWMPEGIAATATWSVDTVPPTVELTGLPFAETAATAAKITVGGAGVVAYRAAVDGGALGVETSVDEPVVLTDLVDGTHAIAVIGRDGAGNWQAEEAATTFTWRVDRSLAVPPTTSLASGSLSRPQVIRFSAPLAEDIHYAYDAPESLTCTTGSSLAIDGELFVDRAVTIYVVACYPGDVPSEVQTFTYTFARGGGGGGGGGTASSVYAPPASTPASVVASAPASVTVPGATPVAGSVLGTRAFASNIILRVHARDLYLVDGGTLHKIPNVRALWRYRNLDRIEVSDADIVGYTVGDNVLAMRAPAPRVLGARAFANGTLLRVNEGAIYLVEGATLRRVPDLKTLWQYRDRERIEVGDDALDRYTVREPIAS